MAGGGRVTATAGRFGLTSAFASADNFRMSRLAPVFLVLVAVGCKMTPASVEPACHSDSSHRNAFLARQIARDSAAEFAARPGASLATAASGPPGWVDVAVVQGVRKRLAGFGPVPPLADCQPLDVAALDAEIARLAPGSAAVPTAFTPIIDGGEAFAALSAVIDSADRRLDVLMYIWDADEIGWAVAKQLAAKAAGGVPVRVLVDLGGNQSQGDKPAVTGEVNAAVCWLAKQPGVTLIRNRNAGGRFDHRKLVLADGRRAWSGGRNFTRTAFESDHDLSFVAEGGAAGEFAAAFEDRWRNQGGEPGEAITPECSAADTTARLLINDTRRPEVTRVLDAALCAARRSVFLENPYLSDSRVVRRLIEARRRGADVRVVLSFDTRSTQFDRGNRVTANRLLAAGVRVYVVPGVTHAKAVSLDGVWAYTGTANFDALSLRRNREFGLALTGAAVGRIDGSLFLPDFRPEWELTAPLPVTVMDRVYAMIASAGG